MMPVDPNIILGIQQPQIISPGQLMSLKEMNLQMQDERLARQRAMAVQQLWQQPGAIDPATGTATLKTITDLSRVDPAAAMEAIKTRAQVSKEQAATMGEHQKLEEGKIKFQTDQQQEMLNYYDGLHKDMPADQRKLAATKEWSARLEKFRDSGQLAALGYSPEEIAKFPTNFDYDSWSTNLAYHKSKLEERDKAASRQNEGKTVVSTTGADGQPVYAVIDKGTGTVKETGAKVAPKTPGLDAGGIDAMVDKVGTYDSKMSTVLARMSSTDKAKFFETLQQKYPDYDETQFESKNKAVKDFTTGSQGNSMRSIATANQHLDQLGKLADALNNHEMPAINSVGNYLGKQFGMTGATNFNAIKNVVGQEVVKAIVAGGGGEAERQEAAAAFDAAKTPAQIKGVIEQYRHVMEAQGENLRKQALAAGVPESRLADYHKPAGKAPDSLSVVAPNGRTYTFKDAASAAAFKKSAGVQ